MREYLPCFSWEFGLYKMQYAPRRRGLRRCHAERERSASLRGAASRRLERASHSLHTTAPSTDERQNQAGSR